MIKVEFCYRIEKDARLVHVVDTGEPSEAYAKIAVTAAKGPETEEEYAHMHNAGRYTLSKNTGIEVDHITPISYMEYDKKSGEELVQESN